VTSTLDPKTGARTFLPLASFVALAYSVSWGWTFPLVAAGDVIEKGVGWPTHFPAPVGPAIAALMVTALVWGRAGVRHLLARMARWRMPLQWFAATLSPLAFLGVALVAASAAGKLSSGSDFGRYSGLSAIGVVPVAVIAILITFGEETGWRGFALPLLQRRYGALSAALLVTPIWAVWHLPYFFTVATYRGFPPVGYVGFVFGIACGSIVLTWLYNGTGGSILACAVWHGLYNLATGTAAATGTIQAVTSAFVYLQALLLVGLELRARRRGETSILGPPPRDAVQASYLVDTVTRRQSSIAFLVRIVRRSA
jgi:membrane protease YdiL (CAAX protease family)